MLRHMGRSDSNLIIIFLLFFFFMCSTLQTSQPRYVSHSWREAQSAVGLAGLFTSAFRNWRAFSFSEGVGGRNDSNAWTGSFRISARILDVLTEVFRSFLQPLRGGSDYATTTSFQALYNSWFINHSTVKKVELLCTAPWRHMRQWMYRSMFSWVRY
jgi:hypothetical protein